MPLRLYNTLTRQKEEFRPLDPANVRLYVCGPTVYDRIHIGNARPIVVFDVLFRLLRREYGDAHVKYARNITDIDDKINNRAKERGIAIGALTAETTRWFHDDLAELGCLPPTVEPTATGHVDEMKAMIRTLIAKGYAYHAQGHVLFSVTAMMQRPPLPDHVYGLLSRKNRDDLIAGARVDVAPYKQDPADFVLWKPSTDDLPGWESPWGRGRPGWHVECSAMSRAHLGETFDIHGGGLDLIFPHHENEIAQSECCNGKPFVRYWMHNGFIERGGEKMAKSVGNIDKVRDLLDEFPGEALRLMLLKTHYRSPLEFTKDGLQEAKNELDGFYRVVEKVSLGERISDASGNPVPRKFIDCLNDDLNTPEYIAHLHKARSELMRTFLEPKGVEYRQQLAEFVSAGAFIGLLQASANVWFRGVGAAPSEVTVATEAASRGGFGVFSVEELARIEDAIEKRAAARKARKFKDADQIRDDLAEQGIVLEDAPDGTTNWRKVGYFGR